MRNFDQTIIGKTHPTLTVESTLLKEHIEANSLTRQKIRDNRIRLNEYTSGGDLLDQLRLVFHWSITSLFCLADMKNPTKVKKQFLMLKKLN